MSQPPLWALTLAFWLHMAATVVWIGGLFYQAAVLNPALARHLPPREQAALLESLRRRFQPLAWLSLAVLVVTGLVQMSGNPNYQGFLAVENRWAAAILAKHLVVLLMVGVAAYQTWAIQPRLVRLLLRPEEPPEGPLSRARRLNALNLALALLTLGLTALARTA